jgi:hypothetical protein
MRRLRLVVLLLIAAVASIAVAACGSSDDGSPAAAKADRNASVDQLLQDTFAGRQRDITSGRIAVGLKLDVTGTSSSDGLDGPFALSLSGPFKSNGKNKLPDFAMAAHVTGAGQDIKAGATAAGGKAYLAYQGTDYVVSDELYKQFVAGFEQAQKNAEQNGTGSASQDTQSLASLGIDPRKWLTNATIANRDAKVGDESTTQITGGVNVNALLDDVQSLLAKAKDLGAAQTKDLPTTLSPADRRQIVEAIKDPKVEIYTGNADHVLRRLVVSLTAAPPEEKGSAAVALDVALTDVGEDLDIPTPSNPKPLDQLMSQLGGLGALSALSTSGGSSSSSSSTSPADSTAKLKKYTDCIQKAGSDADEAADCSKLLTP